MSLHCLVADPGISVRLLTPLNLNLVLLMADQRSRSCLLDRQETRQLTVFAHWLQKSCLWLLVTETIQSYTEVAHTAPN